VLLARILGGALLGLSLACASASVDPSNPVGPAQRISWDEALALIASGEVRRVMQFHALDVWILTASGDRYTTLEPHIDAVTSAVLELAPNADEIALGTE
jgi:hypothetical protein